MTETRLKSLRIGIAAYVVLIGIFLVFRIPGSDS
jgi:hypothetical protein